MTKSTHTTVFRLTGMTCTSCEVISERKIQKLPGVHGVEVNYQTGKCTITHDQTPSLKAHDVQGALNDTHYLVEPWKETSSNKVQRRSLKDIGGIGLLVLAMYLLFKALGLFSFSTGIEESLSYGAIFAIGLVAAFSTCIAVVGGLILSFTAKWKQVHPTATRWQALRPHIYFNLGRLLSYFVLGGMVGLLGTALSPSPRLTGLISILVAVVMILLALDILGISGTRRWIPRMPKRVSYAIHALAERDEPWAPFVLGALTFFLPCGFTQSMQLYALTTGSFIAGALTMSIFALGTMPALVSIGTVASLARGKFAGYFMKVSGALVLMLGIYNIQSGAVLAGIWPGSLSTNSETVSETSVAVNSDGMQVVNMAVEGIQYIPNVINVQANQPVQWQIDGSGATGCTSTIVVPSLKLTEALSPTKLTSIEFTPTEPGTIPFTCGMGMAYGEFRVN